MRPENFRQMALFRVIVGASSFSFFHFCFYNKNRGLQKKNKRKGKICKNSCLGIFSEKKNLFKMPIFIRRYSLVGWPFEFYWLCLTFSFSFLRLQWQLSGLCRYPVPLTCIWYHLRVCLLSLISSLFNSHLNVGRELTLTSKCPLLP